MRSGFSDCVFWWRSCPWGSLPLAFFTIAGLHDYLRWSDAGWELYREALYNGVSPANIQGSFEMNGWHAFDLYESKATPPACRGECRCGSPWYCLDDSYRVGMNVYGNYEVVAQRQPRYWLAPGPPGILSRRQLRPEKGRNQDPPGAPE